MRLIRIFIFLILAAVLTVIVLLTYFTFIHSDAADPRVVYGVTFNADYARYLELDVHKAYTALFDDWQFHYIRLSAQWNNVELERGKFSFDELDWFMNEAAQHGAKVTLAIGQKTPRWPECHLPEWARKLTGDDYTKALDTYIQTVVERYRNHPALEIWQVENEPFLTFGECPPFSPKQLDRELALVRSIDSSHPSITTDSGELSLWNGAVQHADLFGTTLYRVVWNKWTGYMSYDLLPGAFYRFKLWLAGRAPSTAFVSELQAEPWIPNKDFTEVSLAEQYKSMSPNQLKKNVWFAATLGMPRAYLWGAEWWYWLKTQHIMEIPDYIGTLKKQ